MNNITRTRHMPRDQAIAECEEQIMYGLMYADEELLAEDPAQYEHVLDGIKAYQALLYVLEHEASREGVIF